MRPIERLFPGTEDKIKQGICPICGDNATQFRDRLSEQEQKISGLCQDCQDKTFTVDSVWAPVKGDDWK